MQTAKRTCKVCGREYDYCKTWNNTNKFRWQDVACTPACGEKYFALIEASRNPVVEAEEAKPVKVTKKPRKKASQKEAQVEPDATDVTK
jgi:hypothetical protein